MISNASILPPRGYNAIVAAFGDPKFDGSGVDQQWEAASMKSFDDLPLVAPRKLYIHRLIEAPLRAALQACAELGLPYTIDTIGCFAPRQKRGVNQLSVHTFGIAVDINAARNQLLICDVGNPLRTAPGSYDIPDAWIDAFKQCGFTWGGEFQHRFDPMHFQYASGY